MLITFVNFTPDTSRRARVRVPQPLLVTGAEEVSRPLLPTDLSDPAPLPPFIGTSYIGFREALGFKESGGDYFTTNTLGYLGKYQFGIGTLQLMGVYNATRFLESPQLQEKVFETNLARNKWILRKDILRFVGKKIGGVEVTESGILAAAHLAGAGNVKKYLRSGGQWDVVDAYGTSISFYLKKFRGYDISHIEALKNPKVQ